MVCRWCGLSIHDMRRVLKGIVFLVLAVFITCSSLLWLDYRYPPDLKGKLLSTVVTARDGTPLRAFADDKGVWRYPVAVEDVSSLYLKALLAYEDRFFYDHPGVNPFSIFRAAVRNMAAGRIVSGGSTLTMQVARIIHSTKRSFSGKGLQILRALQLEFHLTKEEILSLYLNLAPFGSNIEGVQTASFSWLGKQASELSPAEAALLVVLPQAPSFYRPDRYPERARKARDKVLERMETYGIWTGQTVAAAKKEPVIAIRFSSPVIAPLAARRLHSLYPEKSKIVSFLDFDLQVHVREMVLDYISGLAEEQSGAALIVNYKTLEVIAYVGSADFLNAERKGHVDMVRALRSPGSALKPFLYGLAMDEGLIHSQSLLLDTPRFQQEYEPGNFSNGFTGPVSVTQALRMSLNVPAVQVLEAYGPQKFHDRLINAGAKLELAGKPNLSMILGGLGTDLESLVTLYTGLARAGIAVKPKLFRDDPATEKYLMSPGAAWIICQILAQPMPGFEGINRLAGHVPMAWKTGTSYGFRDAWAFGIMGDYVAGVWVGRPDGSPSPGQYGAVTAIPLLRRIFESLPLSDFRTPQPDSVHTEKICWPLGMAKAASPEGCFVQHEAFILDNKIPLTLTGGFLKNSSLLQTFWVDENQKRSQPSCGGVKKVTLALWPECAEPWLPQAWRRKQLIPPPSETCPDLAPFPGNRVRIISVADNSILTRPPGQVTAPSIELTAMGGQGRYHWFLNRRWLLTVQAGRTGFLPLPLPGTYQLAVADEDGTSDSVNFEVIALTTGYGQ